MQHMLLLSVIAMGFIMAATVADGVHRPLVGAIPPWVSEGGTSDKYNICADLQDALNPAAAMAMADQMCNEAKNAWLQRFPGTAATAFVIPGVGLPSQNKGVCSILHTLPGPLGDAPTVNGLRCTSALCTMGLLNWECSNGQYVILYEIMLPDIIASRPGDKSLVQTYVNHLTTRGLDVSASHYHWTGMSGNTKAIHHQHTGTGISPLEFARITADVQGMIFDEIHRRQG